MRLDIAYDACVICMCPSAARVKHGAERKGASCPSQTGHWRTEPMCLGTCTDPISSVAASGAVRFDVHQAASPPQQATFAQKCVLLPCSADVTQRRRRASTALWQLRQYTYSTSPSARCARQPLTRARSSDVTSHSAWRIRV